MTIFFVVPGNTTSVIASSTAVASLLKVKDKQKNDAYRGERQVIPDDPEMNVRGTSIHLTTNIDVTPSSFRDSCEIQESIYNRSIDTYPSGHDDSSQSLP